MAASIKSTQLILQDKMPGPVLWGESIPAGGWDATQWNFNTSDATALVGNPPYPVGTKIGAYTDNSYCPGWYVMQYLAFHDFSSQDISAKEFSQGTAACSIVNGVACGTKTTYQGGDTTVPAWYFVTRCTTGTSDVTKGMPVCYPCTSMTADSSVVLVSDDNRATGYGNGYGWFWVAGICPAKEGTFFDHSAGGIGGTMPGIGADFTVDSLMRAGPVAAELTSDGIIFVTPDMSNSADATNSVGLFTLNTVAIACVSCGA